jgi:uncharacterized protein (TIGR00255 family)
MRYVLNSMTGFGRGEAEVNQVRLITEIRSVNHRFLDIVVRLPMGWLAFEEEVKRVVKQYVSRGRIDVFVTVEGKTTPERQVLVDWNLLDGYMQAAMQIQERYTSQEDQLRLSDLIRLPDLFVLTEGKWDQDFYHSLLMTSLKKACKALKAMREAEGQHLAQDLEGRVNRLSQIMKEMESIAPSVTEQLEKRLYHKLDEWIQNNKEVADRILAEIALFADRADITEELIRLKSHVNQFYQCLQATEPVGRKLDFLIQEMNREINTIGSKSNHPEISRQVVDAKSELEKMKEQIQNIE